MSNDKKLENLQKALGQNLGGLDGALKPNLDGGFAQNNSESQLKMKLGQSGVGQMKNDHKSFNDPKGVNKQVLKGNAKARK